jgi:hypothetical protein
MKFILSIIILLTFNGCSLIQKVNYNINHNTIQKNEKEYKIIFASNYNEESAKNAYKKAKIKIFFKEIYTDKLKKILNSALVSDKEKGDIYQLLFGEIKIKKVAKVSSDIDLIKIYSKEHTIGYYIINNIDFSNLKNDDIILNIVDSNIGLVNIDITTNRVNYNAENVYKKGNSYYLFSKLEKEKSNWYDLSIVKSYDHYYITTLNTNNRNNSYSFIFIPLLINAAKNRSDAYNNYKQTESYSEADTSIKYDIKINSEDKCFNKSVASIKYDTNINEINGYAIIKGQVKDNRLIFVDSLMFLVP